MLRYKDFEPMKHLEVGKTYECVVSVEDITHDEKKKYVLVDALYSEDGFPREIRDYVVHVSDNSVLNVLAVTNPDKFYEIVCEDRYEDEYPDSKQEWCEMKNKDVIINIRVPRIKEWIKNRVEDKETNTCFWGIRVNGFYGNIYSDPKIKEITDILDRNGVEWQACDNMSGAWNLNHDWIETKEMECAIEYCGVYPVNWKDVKDIAWFEFMVNAGYLYIHVMVKDKDGKWVNNL